MAGGRKHRVGEWRPHLFSGISFLTFRSTPNISPFVAMPLRTDL